MELCIYSGSANPTLAAAVASKLSLPKGNMRLKRFSDGEIHCQIDESIRGREVFIIQSTCTPVNDNLVELLLMIDAFRRASAGRITCVIPYFGYSRQEKKTTGREPISAKLVANLLSSAGANRVVSIDLHSPAIQGFFDIWMDHLTAVPIIVSYLQSIRRPDSVIVAPDAGGVKLADAYAHALDLPLVVMHKRRSAHEKTEVRAVVGDIRNKCPIIVDDVISTAGTISEGSRALLAAGCKPTITVAVTHPLLVGPAIERLEIPEIVEVITTDTIPIPTSRLVSKITVLSTADLIAETIKRLHDDRSISALFTPSYQSYPV